MKKLLPNTTIKGKAAFCFLLPPLLLLARFSYDEIFLRSGDFNGIAEDAIPIPWAPATTLTADILKGKTTRICLETTSGTVPVAALAEALSFWWRNLEQSAAWPRGEFERPDVQVGECPPGAYVITRGSEFHFLPRRIEVPSFKTSWLRMAVGAFLGVGAAGPHGQPPPEPPDFSSHGRDALSSIIEAIRGKPRQCREIEGSDYCEHSPWIPTYVEPGVVRVAISPFRHFLPKASLRFQNNAPLAIRARYGHAVLIGPLARVSEEELPRSHYGIELREGWAIFGDLELVKQEPQGR